MMKDNKCVICKHKDLPLSSRYSSEKIFDHGGDCVNITLCHSHAVDLFKTGQRKFLLSHYDMITNIISTEDSKFMKILTNTARKNADAIY